MATWDTTSGGVAATWDSSSGNVAAIWDSTIFDSWVKMGTTQWENLILYNWNSWVNQ